MANADMKLVFAMAARDDGAVRLLRDTERQLLRTDKTRRQLAQANRSHALAGIRSEKETQREIRQTEAAFRRLARSGTASQNDLARAAVATKNKVAELNAELNQGLRNQSRFGRAASGIGRFGAAALAGGTAAYMAVSPALERYKALDLRLRETVWAAHGQTRGTDTAFLEGQALSEMRGLIADLVKANGGHTDLAVDTVQGMLANGMDFEAVKRNATATHALAKAAGENGHYDGAAAAKLAQVFANNGFDVARATQMAAFSGMQGTFELDDMVKNLPALLPDARAAGFTGEAGLAFLLSALQSAANKSGSSDEAANNVKNILQKSLSADTVKRMDTLLKERGSGADWRQMLLAGQREGKNAVQVLGDFAQQMLSEDKEYQAAKARADAGDENARQQVATLTALLVAKLIPDMQARAGLNAMLDTGQMNAFFQELTGNQSDVIANKNAYLANSAANRQEQAEALRDLGLQESQTFEHLAAAETGFKNLTAEFPVATEALKALAAAATAAAVAQGAMGLLGKGGGLAGGLGRGAVLGTGARFGAAGLAAAAGGIGLKDANARINRNEHRGFFEGGLDSRAAGYGESALSGAALGAAVGSLIPVIGTAVGAGAGALFGLAAAAFADWQKDSQAAGAAGGQAALDAALTQSDAARQSDMLAQTAAFQAALQADTAAVGGKLDAIHGTLGGMNQTIQNNMTVHLDGRVIANEVSRHQVAMFGRGAGQ